MSRGQFFTVSDELQQTVFKLVAHKGSRLLEPSFGKGHLLRPFLLENPNYPFHAYEIDDKLEPCILLGNDQYIRYEDFTTATLQEKYKTIIGNPPYVKTRNGCNLYLQFIKKCWNSLDKEGELIFIVPSDFIKLTSAAKLIERMVETGSFTDFVFPNNERLFEGANVDVVVFRYQLGAKSQTAMVNGVNKQCEISHGIITFFDVGEVLRRHIEVSDVFHVAVGFVSGKEDVFSHDEIGNVEVLQDENKVGKYILINGFPCDDARINEHLTSHKESFLKRRIRRFGEQNWFEWGALRNKKLVETHMGRQCIYVRTITRKQMVAFPGNVQYFGGGLLCMIPKDPRMPIDALEATMSFLNSQENRQNYTYAGRFKLGHRQLSHIKVHDDHLAA